MKFSSAIGTLEYNNTYFPCYMMRKGLPLSNAIKEKDACLDFPQNVMQFIATLINGINALKNEGLSHGDIKADNILLIKYNENFYALLSDYGTISGEKIPIRTNPYLCDANEYASPMRKPFFCPFYIEIMKKNHPLQTLTNDC